MKVGLRYPERSARLPCADGAVRRRDEWAEFSRKHSRATNRTEGPNPWYGKEAERYDEDRRRRVL